MVVAYLGIGALVSRYIFKPWLLREFDCYDTMTACAVGLLWPLALGVGGLLACVQAFGWLFGGEDDDSHKNWAE